MSAARRAACGIKEGRHPNGKSEEYSALFPYPGNNAGTENPRPSPLISTRVQPGIGEEAGLQPLQRFAARSGKTVKTVYGTSSRKHPAEAGC